MDNDGASSIYSSGSNKNPVARATRHGANTGSRPNSYTPSYMSNIQARPPDTPSDYSPPEAGSYRFHERAPSQITLKIPRRPVSSAFKASSPARDKAAAASSGLLLIVFASAPHPSTTFFLETLLAHRSFSAIAVAGGEEQEAAIKQLKIEIYALIGRMQKELGVYTYLRSVWTEAEMAAVVQDAVKGSAASGVQGIICSPEFDESGTTGVDILSLPEHALQRSWKQSTGFLHAASRATAPLLLAKAVDANSPINKALTSPGSRAPFFLVAGSSSFTATAQIAKAACDTLVRLLEKELQPKGVTVGYAEALLVRERSSRGNDDDDNVDYSVAVDHENNGSNTFLTPGGPTETFNDAGFTPSESPTRLWNMWAVQNDD